MTKKNATKTATAPADSQKIPVEIAGQTYHLNFEIGALSDAEEYFSQRGANVNLLRDLSSLSLQGVRNVFPCAIHLHHPEIEFKAAQRLLTLQATYEVAACIAALWNQPAPVAE